MTASHGFGLSARSRQTLVQRASVKLLAVYETDIRSKTNRDKHACSLGAEPQLWDYSCRANYSWVSLLGNEKVVCVLSSPDKMGWSHSCCTGANYGVQDMEDAHSNSHI
jgi:hypothetical protein